MTRIIRDLKDGELTVKDMSVLREGEVARTQYKKTSGSIRDYSLKHTIRMAWGELKEERRDLRPFHLYIDNTRYLISWGELKDMDAGGFFRREEGNPTAYQLKYLDGPKIRLDVELNEEAKRDMIFRMTGDTFEVLIDWYEMMRTGRFI